ncbi:cyclodeaminase [Paracoccus denitrificans]|jgi:ornithine cyclodeaminase|uniref:Ornithine cyclodeaminase n=1 Tax=Paracoccus denitrificans (strain Pd 1222) TaxID=318586 RepID=A1AYQ6_PARDP|nr:cyclodeaminase [Paracoccus denitrificans]ABL68400.1 Ornithine cyclodeaminase [Paracoccus denitrificans PD1222]MBB4627918.1 ornithine cyclodeaminase [Paracoccus denitrificans]MCU7428550.1 cyclodeaminase [Paracoccus denitrificans]QAR26477.1 cyclodeaminase [Paracoccus denitrificans]UPV95414.1 cyclodeaminase [Paracoccus denitrificans]
MRPPVTILTETDLRALVPLDAKAVACIRDAFVALATKPVAMPPILRLDIPEHRGEVDVKTAYVPGLTHFAIKISPGFFGNPALGLPSTNGMMVVLSSRTGLVEALLLDNGYLTDVRTAAAGAVAADALARPDAATAAILGAGMQARMQLQALALVRRLTGVRVWARDPAKAQAFAAEMTAILRIPVTAGASVAEAARDADLVVTTTPSESPILSAADIAPGTHVTAMGSDAGHKNEIAPDLIAAAHYVADRLSQTRTLGELHHSPLVGRDFPELGQILAGQRPGRTDPAQITLADLTGTGIQDTAIATLALARAGKAGAGRTFTL